ncbi:MAG: hypothetical protein Q8R02_05005 [Hyphomonadaceae bacterium]|nr:hypothetical protein [Hyphomonadaceae bacterium]
MSGVTFKQANRRYRRAFIPAMIAYAIICLGGAFLFKSLDDPPVWASALIAVLTAAPMGVVFWLMWRLMRETDEFSRLQQAMAMAGGGMITAFACTVWGFLELYDVAPSMWAFLVGPMFLLNYGLIHRFAFQGPCEPGFGK